MPFALFFTREARANLEDLERDAYRVFWCYGSEQGQITVIAITSHP